MLADDHLKYLTEVRKLDSETIAKLGVESCVLQDGGNFITFPFYVGSEIVNRKYRSLDKQFCQDKGGQQVFWNINTLMDSSLDESPVIITEGEIDAITAIQCGYVRTVSVPAGAPQKSLGDGQTARYAFLDDAKKLFAGAKEIILATDGDEAGIALMQDLALRLGKVRCKYLVYPFRPDRKSRCKDLNEVLQLWGDKGVSQTINGALWLKRDGVYSMGELAPVEERATFKIGMDGVDDHWLVRKKDFIVVTGIPSHGKSSFLNDVCCRLAQNHKWRIAFASFEQEPQTDHRRNLRAWHIKKMPKYANAEQLEQADRFIEDYFRFIVPGEDDSSNLEWMLEKISQAVVQHDCDMVVIDPWNEMEHSRPRDMSMTEYTGFAIREFKRIAKALNIALVVAAHPTKRDDEDGVPGLYNISDSAHWANKADIGIVLFRPNKTDNLTEVHVQKVKYRGINGREGVIKMHFLDQMNRYELIPNDYLAAR